MCSLDGHGKYHLFGCDHNIRIRIIYRSNIQDAINDLEDAGGHYP